MKPDTCHCCKPPTGGTPVAVNNRPGLAAIAYRVGTFAHFRQAMFQGISRSAALRDLSTRRSDDYAITILELWAAVADILTFYQERIANEAFLRTARGRDAVLRMARMIGYELAPGSAATALLSFTADKGQQVRVPVGLRMQSVPEQDEKPQKYETLEALTVCHWLNEQRLFAAPVGINPLAKGSTAAYLAAGEEGLRLAENLIAGDRVLLFDPARLEPLEELVVKELVPEHEHMRLRWSKPLQGAHWDMNTRGFKLVRSLRLFGYNVPPSYPKANMSSGIIQTWKIQNIGTGSPGTDNFAIAGANVLYLDRVYDDLKVGTRLLLADGTTQQKLLTVTAVDQDDTTLGSVTDTVTRVTVTPSFAQIDDRRQAVVYELTGPPLTFWGFTYPDTIVSATVYIPGHRIDPQTIAIARPIAKNAYGDGYTLKLADIETGRRAIVKDQSEEPLAARLNRVEITGNEIVCGVTPDDAQTVYLLGLDPDTARTVATLCSASLATFPTLASTAPALAVTIGGLGPRTVTLSGTLNSVDSAAASLATALQGADTDPLFAEATVIALDDRLVVLAGDWEAAVAFSKTAAAETTLVELGLDREQVQTLTGLRSGELDPVPPYTEVPPQLAVSIGPLESKTIDLDATAATLAGIAADLQAKLNVADIAPFFKYARVVVIADSLLVFPGPIGAIH
ncbi:MAG: hypothetical protein JSW39_26925 [Desulfobacterales bacterium]|nr:MAG: hypothetical protein JSW39_26925 [Desulfobacterales bacterium]